MKSVTQGSAGSLHSLDTCCLQCLSRVNLCVDAELSKIWIRVFSDCNGMWANLGQAIMKCQWIVRIIVVVLLLLNSVMWFFTPYQGYRGLKDWEVHESTPFIGPNWVKLPHSEVKVLCFGHGHLEAINIALSNTECWCHAIVKSCYGPLFPLEIYLIMFTIKCCWS